MKKWAWLFNIINILLGALLVSLIALTTLSSFEDKVVLRFERYIKGFFDLNSFSFYRSNQIGIWVTLILGTFLTLFLVWQDNLLKENKK